uniref:Uncharacterized protein n=1 Tax=Anguilla anguilla TaxID=7936 RepID=A0A0E9WQ55_ANGAN
MSFFIPTTEMWRTGSISPTTLWQDSSPTSLSLPVPCKSTASFLRRASVVQRVLFQFSLMNQIACTHRAPPLIPAYLPHPQIHHLAWFKKTKSKPIPHGGRSTQILYGYPC